MSLNIFVNNLVKLAAQTFAQKVK